MGRISTLFRQMCVSGLQFPFAFDPQEKQPSVTLFFAYIGFYSVLGSIIYLYFHPENPEPTIYSILVWVIALTLYRLRKLDKIKVNLKEKSIDLEGSDNK